MLNTKLKIKVCGMRDPANIQAVSALPVDFMGFIFYAKSPRFVPHKPAYMPQHIQKVGVFVNENVETIIDTVQAYELQMVQLHGDEAPATVQQLKAHGLQIIKAFGIDDAFNWDTLTPYVPFTDFFLFDTKSNAYGGTGITFNWDKLKSYPLETPYFLSGGLALTNVKDALDFAHHDARLYALDLNSKFESEPGIKNIQSLANAFTIVQNEQISSR